MLLLIVNHFTLKDTYYWTSIGFYAFPLPVIMAGLFGLFFLDKRQKYYLYALLILSVLWFKSSYQYNPQWQAENPLEIVLWNASHTQTLEDLFASIDSNPDVVVMVEGDGVSEKLPFDNGYLYRSRKDVVVWSKDRIEKPEEIYAPNKSALLKLETFGLQFYVVDISAGISNFRKKDMEFVVSHVGSASKTIVLGDFNTPFESVHLKKMKKNFEHAFDKSGQGFRETWPWNLPALSLDHIWVSRDLNLQKTDKIHTWKSDHSILRTVINK